MNIGRIIEKIRTRVIPNVRYLPQSRIRRCLCCEKWSVIASLSDGEEFKICIRCRANLRYEMIANVLRRKFHGLRDMDVVELDPCSPLGRILKEARSYLRTYYSASDKIGSVRGDGAQCEDITRLSFVDKSVDLIVSSDVLEHVPDIVKASSEIFRVLRPGGVHLFTVPTRPITQQRATIKNGVVEHLLTPDYHSDPLNPNGILAFWDFGLDAAKVFASRGLEVSIAAGPIGKDQRVVWMARKP